MLFLKDPSRILGTNKTKLYCFSPAVMLATFVIEMLLAVYTYFRYKSTFFSHLTVVLIILLSGFQLAEYQICGGRDALLWARIGFVIVTLLPVLGLHLISLITNKLSYLKLGYIAMALFVFIFALIPGSLTNATCGGNYIIFNSQSNLMWLYGFYYFGFLFLGLWEAFDYLQKKKSEALEWIMIGYISFMLPMGLVYIISPSVRSAVPSVMCGFAIILALILALKVVPEYNKENKKLKIKNKKPRE
ncbi:MAG: hypothetical protein PHU42_00370 [Patescibacteria group bacterium]|nr:hypothetical protein [Patescibacteria group bacterium]